MIMSDLILIPHIDVTKIQLEDIIKIKSTAWPYDFDDQVKWINAHLKGTDIHVLLSSNNKYRAYLNLIDIEIKIDGELFNGYGIGNVCALEKGKGWGKELILKTNAFLYENNRIGLLFCRDLLVDFYRLCNWEILKRELTNITFENKSIESMIFIYNKEFYNLEYLGNPF